MDFDCKKNGIGLKERNTFFSLPFCLFLGRRFLASAAQVVTVLLPHTLDPPSVGYLVVHTTILLYFVSKKKKK